MLNFQVVQAPMRFGLAEGVEPHQVPFGTLSRAENACWSKTGLLEKRRGTQALDTNIVGGGSLAAARRLVVRGDELSLIDGEHIYTRTAAGWIDGGTIPNIGLTWQVTLAGLTTVKSSDSVVVGTNLIEAWVQGPKGASAAIDNTLMFQVRELASSSFVARPTPVALVSPASPIRVLQSGGAWFIVVLDGSNGNVLVFTAGALTVLATNGAETASQSLDAIVVGGDLVIAYAKNAGGIALLRVNASTLAISATGAVTGESSALITTLSIASAPTEPLHIAWITSGEATDKVRYASADVSTLVQTHAPVDLNSGAFEASTAVMTCARYSATQCILVYSCADATGSSGQVSFNVIVSTSAGVTTGGPRSWNIAPVTKPVLNAADGRWYVFASNTTARAGVSTIVGSTWPISDTFLFDVTLEANAEQPRLSGKVESLTGALWTHGHSSSISADSSGALYAHVPFALEVADETVGIANEPLRGVHLVTMTPGGGADMWRPLDLDREAYFCAGTLFGFDGVEPVGYGWPFGPLIAKHPASTTGGTIAAGTYLYNVIAERRSAGGVLHRSPIAEDTPVTTTGATSSVSVGVMMCSAGHARTSPGAFIFYRTTVNGSIVQRIGSPPRFMSILDVGILPPASAVTDVSADGDVGLATHPALYTAGGELEDMQPVACSSLAYHQNRIWLIAGDGSVWFSKDRSSNPDVAPGFHPTQIFTFDRTPTALASLDEKLIVFAADRIWIIVGEGPPPNGQGASYQVVPLPSDLGCINPRSVVVSPHGILFESARGIYILTRALELSWIGAPVSDELDTYRTITSAVLVASRNEIRFTANGTVVIGEEGGLPVTDTRSTVLVYNYVENQWTPSVYRSGAPIVDACMWQGRWTAATNTGTVFYETTENRLDTNADGTTSAWVPITVETAWINAGGPLSFQSVRNFSFEGVARTAHSLTIDVGFDSDNAYPQSKTFDVEDLGAESFEISIGPRRKCHSIRFRITDAAPPVIGANTGDGMSLAILGIEVGQKRGFPTKPAAKTG